MASASMGPGMVFCPNCNQYHASLTVCPNWKALVPKPLPPTAEETSIGRFNALADEIRDFRKETARAYIDGNALFSGKLDALTNEICELRKDVWALMVTVREYQPARLEASLATLTERVGRSIEDILRLDHRVKLMQPKPRRTKGAGSKRRQR